MFVFLYLNHTIPTNFNPTLLLAFFLVTLLIPKGLNPITSQIYISRHVLFNEHDFSLSSPLSSKPTTSHPTQSILPTHPFLLFMSDTANTPSSIPSQPVLPTPASVTINHTPTDPMHTPVSASVHNLVTTQVLASVSTLVTIPVLDPITALDPNPSISPPPLIPLICLIAPQVAPMFQVPSVTNTHSMVTRSKVGVFKPKALVAQAVSSEPQSLVQSAKPFKPSSKALRPDYTLTEPSSYKVAVQYPQWCAAMDEQFAALQRQGTWSLVPHSPFRM